MPKLKLDKLDDSPISFDLSEEDIKYYCAYTAYNFSMPH
jgi:hypothetical protein